MMLNHKSKSCPSMTVLNDKYVFCRATADDRSVLARTARIYRVSLYSTVVRTESSLFLYSLS